MLLLGVWVTFVALILQHMKPPYWYDTMVAFVAGVAYGMWHDKVETMLKRSDTIYFAMLGLCAIVVLWGDNIPWIRNFHIVNFGIRCVAFSLAIVLATMKIELKSNMLRWVGEHLFPIYIYQRISMLAFVSLDPQAFVTWRCWLYFLASVLATYAITLAYPLIHISFKKMEGK